MPAGYLRNGLPRVNARLRIDYRRDVAWSCITVAACRWERAHRIAVRTELILTRRRLPG
jgi:hypothetical protein